MASDLIKENKKLREEIKAYKYALALLKSAKEQEERMHQWRKDNPIVRGSCDV